MSDISLKRLAAVAGPSLGAAEPFLSADILALVGTAALALRHLLSLKNGFYAFESALHVFGAGRVSVGERDLSDWNSPQLWRSEFHEMADGCLFFAEDIFGGQFCFASGQVCSFDPETGQLQPVASSLDGWAEAILADPELLTGCELGHEWQQRHGRVPQAKRLVPATSFVLGGDFHVSNLNAVDAVEGMRARGRIATQIRDLPDGARVELRVVDDDEQP